MFAWPIPGRPSELPRELAGVGVAGKASYTVCHAHCVRSWSIYHEKSFAWHRMNVTTCQKIQKYGGIEGDEKEEGDQQYGGSKEGDEDGLGGDEL
ncbi:unnamed protein product [Allacma fusca]|uniref:Uncharacterized protein n=1 Tax=Allacma fusca TaxID=39272 RepID=A0A8J2PKM3_9HEXA|nr:unnamed protein product [Allacma fusca]